jgi:hypothetical protein
VVVTVKDSILAVIRQNAESCAALECKVPDLMCETLSWINSMCAVAAIELRHEVSRDEA